jgi:hypothetical protein
MSGREYARESDRDPKEDQGRDLGLSTDPTTLPIVVNIVTEPPIRDHPPVEFLGASHVAGSPEKEKWCGGKEGDKDSHDPHDDSNCPQRNKQSAYPLVQANTEGIRTIGRFGSISAGPLW